MKSTVPPERSPFQHRGIQAWLRGASARWFSAYCIAAAFGTYFCMYAFRKPFTAGTFEGEIWGGLGLKTLFVASQVFGYTMSKFIGIKVVSEMPPARRAIAILALIGIAEVALLLFAVTPSPWSAVWLFVNGLPLGMVFGLVLAFLEGRRQTEVLAAGLCASFILSSGVVKSVGRGLIENDSVSETWMPVVTGALFIVPLIFFVMMLAQIPAPKAEDVAERSERAPMNHQRRRDFFRRYRFGVIGLVGTYLLLTVGRSLRDDFAVEIWRDLGYGGKPANFAESELLVTFGVLLAVAIMVRIRSNARAFLGSLILSACGLGLLVLSVVLVQAGAISGFTFMVLSGMGLYVPYVAFHTTVFERLIATFRERGTIGYLMYLADAVGYLGYVAMMFVRNWLAGTDGFLELYTWTSIGIAILSVVGTLLVARYFSSKMTAARVAPTH